MFSKACEYAIKSMIFIEFRGNDAQKARLNEIAQAIESPVAFTAKILQQLKKNGLLQSTIGPKGGFQINKKSITIMEIVSAIDGDSFLNKCILGLKVCSASHPCPAHDTYAKIKEILIQDLLNIHLIEFSKLVENQSASLK